MKIPGLLRDQKIEIDMHQYGSGLAHDWDIPSADVHIDKFIESNKDKYNGRRENLLAQQN